ncbi:protein YjeN [Escherichia coli]|uniref:protein YjeN n=1 Tax=Escherichia coli TaxID=562 RepID=UPI000E0321E1|nr:protein YjeN [Escherichia coli]EFL6468090.1 hypothetical protein [Escherichia coli]EIH9536893.1 hypothetical protein [Escherichia coli]EIH9540103.1 hypothetical protein [Escherichia coli]STH27383.1 Uncharacterised protein [Escherichia coli]VFS93832.1 Uncharacterised protein [Escherichia coli]
MDDTSRDPAITEDEIRALQFSAGDVAEIEQTILSFVDACHIRKVAMVVGSTINTLKDRDGKRWGNLPDIYCAYLIRCLVFRGELVGYGDLFRMRYSEIKRPVTL